MNRRQEIALYVTGLTLAIISWAQGAHGHEWLFELFVPALIVGVLVIYAVRDRSVGSAAAEKVLKGGMWVLLVVASIGYLDTRADKSAWTVREVAESAEESARRAQSEVNELASKVRELEWRVDSIQ